MDLAFALRLPSIRDVVVADNFDQLTPDLFVWNAYDSAVKVDLFSSAVRASAGVFLVDPILLADAARDELLGGKSPAGIIVTNSNHERASRKFSTRFDTTVWSDRASFPDDLPPRFADVRDLTKIDNDVRVIAIEGAAPGEIALCFQRSLIVGDALINFPPNGFSPLPAKYCQDPKQMRRSLGQLLELEFDRIVFAHGEPIAVNARERLVRLLEDSE